MRRWPGALLAVVAACAGILWLLPAQPAQAHTQLLSSSPGNGERLAAPPAEVVLRFGEEVSPVTAGTSVSGPGGEVDTGAVRADPKQPRQVVIPLPDRLGDGVYTVAWRVVSADSHPIHGALVFGVGDAATGPLPAAGAQTDSQPALSAAFAAVRWLGYPALALLAGGAG
ncbi:copper resistance CopC family protein, partial [Streptomyces phytophilus]|uniref:copper resistance CopC family protein n=1 Tax=Streptomyces phytophilus TaxID=722715 RepID=UPI0015F06E4C